MAKQVVETMVEGGKATAAPPLGPALGPTGVNIGLVVAEINKKTADMKGMQVPVKVTVDTATKSFDIEIGTPPASALIKKEAGIEKGSGKPNTMASQKKRPWLFGRFGSKIPRMLLPRPCRLGRGWRRM